MLSSLWKHPHLISACWSQTSARNTTLQVFSPPSAEIVQSGGFHVIISFGSNGTKTLSQWDWWWWCMSLQPMRLRNVPDFLDWTFPASNMQDHKGKQKIQEKYLQWNLATWSIGGGTMKRNTSKAWQRKISRCFRKQKYSDVLSVHANSMSMCLICAVKANAHIYLG